MNSKWICENMVTVNNILTVQIVCFGCNLPLARLKSHFSFLPRHTIRIDGNATTTEKVVCHYQQELPLITLFLNDAKTEEPNAHQATAGTT